MKWNFTHRFHGRLVAYIIGCITATNKPTIAWMRNEPRATIFACNSTIMHLDNLIQLDHDFHLSCTQMFAHIAALSHSQAKETRITSPNASSKTVLSSRVLDLLWYRRYVDETY